MLSSSCSHPRGTVPRENGLPHRVGKSKKIRSGFPERMLLEMSLNYFRSPMKLTVVLVVSGMVATSAETVISPLNMAATIAA